MSTFSSTRSRLRTVDMAYISLFAVLMAVCAWISIPMPVPFTLQTFAVFAALTCLGGRRGVYAVAVYLLMGAIGLPVFSGFQGGLGALLGTTGGYLTGFLVSALLFWFFTAIWGTSLPVTVAACLVGLAACYLFGTAWFLVVYTRTTGSTDLITALRWCVFPFLVPDLCKLGLAVLISRKIGIHLSL